MSSQTFQEFKRLTARHAQQEGLNLSPIANFGTARFSNPHARQAEFYEPTLLMVAQGEKYAYMGQQRYNFSAGQMLAVFLPMPLHCEMLQASPEKPWLVAGLLIDSVRLSDMAIRIDRFEGRPRREQRGHGSGVFSIPLDDIMLETTVRLFRALDDEREAAVLGERIVDEIYYRLLVGEQGHTLRSMIQHKGEVQLIAAAVDHLHKHLDQPVSVEELADLVHMSRTSFFEHFKRVMHVSPLQYAKGLKLHRAQALLQEGKTASEAGYSVGYNSPAQFSREYKRHFGFAPSAT